LFEPRACTDQHHAAFKPTQAVTAAEPPAAVLSSSYTLSPLAHLSVSSSADPLDLRYDLGLAVLRKTSLKDDIASKSSSRSSSNQNSSTISIAIPSVMSLAPASPSRSRKRLSDSATGKPQWLQQLPRLSAEHQRLFQTVQKLQLKVGKHCNMVLYDQSDSVLYRKLSGKHIVFAAQLARKQCVYAPSRHRGVLA
jgi:hypothetical protein